MKQAFQTLFILFFSLSNGLVAQISEQKKSFLDSVYKIAVNEEIDLETRAVAYNKCCTKTVYSDYQIGLNYCEEFLFFSLKHDLPIRITRACHFKGYAEMMLGDFSSAETSYNLGLEISNFIERLKMFSAILK